MRKKLNFFVGGSRVSIRLDPENIRDMKFGIKTLFILTLAVFVNLVSAASQKYNVPVSYTHLTLPTKRIV